MALTGLWNWTIERLAYRPLRGSFRLAPLISAIGMSIFLSNFVQVVQGPRNKPAPQLPNHVFNLTDGLGGAKGDYSVTLSIRQILIMVVTTILLARLLVSRPAYFARPRPARLRAGPEDGGAARN